MLQFRFIPHILHIRVLAFPTYFLECYIKLHILSIFFTFNFNWKVHIFVCILVKYLITSTLPKGFSTRNGNSEKYNSCEKSSELKPPGNSAHHCGLRVLDFSKVSSGAPLYCSSNPFHSRQIYSSTPNDLLSCPEVFESGLILYEKFNGLSSTLCNRYHFGTSFNMSGVKVNFLGMG